MSGRKKTAIYRVRFSRLLLGVLTLHLLRGFLTLTEMRLVVKVIVIDYYFLLYL